MADRIFRVAREALQRESDGTFYRLLGVGLANICPAHQCDPPDLADPGASRRTSAERAMDRVRAKYGEDAVGKGRGLRSTG
jgi:DNA polymerase-4